MLSGKKFSNILTAEKWLLENYFDFLKKIYNEYNVENTLGEALFYYTGNMSFTYNFILKLNSGNIDNIEKLLEQYYPDSLFMNEYDINRIKLIYNSFNLKIPEDIILFHYFSKENYEIDFQNEKEFVINNFISTTMLEESPKTANNYNCILKIAVKKGVKCIPIGNNPHSCLREFEIILPPKTKFKINKVKKNIFSKVKIIECEIL